MEKLLNVLVAEALGWVRAADGLSYVSPEGGRWALTGRYDPIPRYDTDWSATGPLIDEHSICLNHCWPGDHGQDGFHWVAFRSGDVRHPEPSIYSIEAAGETPLIAVCNLILALKEAGKL